MPALPTRAPTSAGDRRHRVRIPAQPDDRLDRRAVVVGMTEEGVDGDGNGVGDVPGDAAGELQLGRELGNGFVGFVGRDERCEVLEQVACWATSQYQTLKDTHNIGW
jgi:hypothetical protein